MYLDIQVCHSASYVILLNQSRVLHLQFHQNVDSSLLILMYCGKELDRTFLSYQKEMQSYHFYVNILRLFKDIIKDTDSK